MIISLTLTDFQAKHTTKISKAAIEVRFAFNFFSPFLFVLLKHRKGRLFFSLCPGDGKFYSYIFLFTVQRATMLFSFCFLRVGVCMCAPFSDMRSGSWRMPPSAWRKSDHHTAPISALCSRRLVFIPHTPSYPQTHTTLVPFYSLSIFMFLTPCTLVALFSP